MSVITAKGLIKDYNSFRAVNDIEFEIQEGECFGFLGPNGAGKTTVMRILYCFMPPSYGTVEVLGTNVLINPSLIKSKMGVMPQEDNLDVDLNVLQNLIVYGRYFDIPKEKSKPLAMELLEYVELAGKSDASILSLSGGMKRSLSLARSLINCPEILVLDEPTTGLDPYNRRMVWNKLNDVKSKNTTLVLTTHYMEEADKLCDRVAIMDAGRILTVDSPSNLKKIHGGSLEDVYLQLTGRSLEP
jgi:lipooligosaccharide transport system ATP-binding protein